MTEYVPEELVRTFRTDELPWAAADRAGGIVSAKIAARGILFIPDDLVEQAYNEVLAGHGYTARIGDQYFVTFKSREDYVAWLLTV